MSNGNSVTQFRSNSMAEFPGQLDKTTTWFVKVARSVITCLG